MISGRWRTKSTTGTRALLDGLNQDAGLGEIDAFVSHEQPDPVLLAQVLSDGSLLLQPALDVLRCAVCVPFAGDAYVSHHIQPYRLENGRVEPLLRGWFREKQHLFWVHRD
jgi:hypothetical protein